jgi:hypothetical protein
MDDVFDFVDVDWCLACIDVLYRVKHMAGLEDGPGVALGHGRRADKDKRARIAE